MVTLVCLCMQCAAKLILKGIIIIIVLNHFCYFVTLERELTVAVYAMSCPRNCWVVYYAVLALLLL